MNANPSSAPPSPAVALVDGRGALRLTPVAPISHPSFALTHPYVELVYTSSLGTSAVAVARSFGRLLALHRAPISICPIALALELGMRSSNGGDLLGRRSTLRGAIDRLEHERLVRWIGDHQLAVHTAVPAVSDRVRDKLPPAARQAHDHFVNVIDLRDGRT